MGSGPFNLLPVAGGPQEALPWPWPTCVAGALAVDLAPSTLTLFHLALAHSGPAIACLQVLIACLIKAFFWGSQVPCVPLHWGRCLLCPCSQALARPQEPQPPCSPVSQFLPVKAMGQVQW